MILSLHRFLMLEILDWRVRESVSGFCKCTLLFSWCFISETSCLRPVILEWSFLFSISRNSILLSIFLQWNVQYEKVDSMAISVGLYINLGLLLLLSKASNCLLGDEGINEEGQSDGEGFGVTMA